MPWLKFTVCTLFCMNNIETLSSRSVCGFNERQLNYYKVKICYKSNLPIIAWVRTPVLGECMEFARRKKALAFNFSPEEASGHKDFSQNCQVLGCPETENSSTLIEDAAFDYYSAYGNLNSELCIFSKASLKKKDSCTNHIIVWRKFFSKQVFF